MNKLLPITQKLIDALRKQNDKDLPCSDNKPIQVLVVEDNSNDAMFMQRTLVGIGCEVTIIGNGTEAAGLLRSNPTKFCIMFLDIGLPGMDGMDVLKLTHQLAPNVHIVVVTGGNRLDEIPPEVYYGVVRKPLTEDLAAEIIDKTTGAK